MPGRTRSRRTRVDGVARDLGRQRRPRADQAHVAAQDVDQLGQLVDRVAAQPAAGPGDPRVVLHLEQTVLVAGPRVQLGAAAASASTTMERNFRQRNVVPSRPVALLREEHRPAVVQLDPERGEQRAAARTGAAAHASRPRRRRACRRGRRRTARGLSMCISGKAADGPHADPLGGDVGDAGGDHHLDVMVLELPGHPAQLAGGVERATGEEDHVGFGVLERLERAGPGCRGPGRRRRSRSGRPHRGRGRRPRGSPSHVSRRSTRAISSTCEGVPAMRTRCWRRRACGRRRARVGAGTGRGSARGHRAGRAGRRSRGRAGTWPGSARRRPARRRPGWR